ncbi:MAG: DUF554 domain-containing protein [Candidatus Heimdallarchaeota archaeon]|nr:DUF554 domain-containing protein [Candidatus Heimdallarchaeota archaeon]
MIGTLINCGTVIIGSIIGLTLGRFYTEDMKTITIKSIGLLTLVIGIDMVLSSGRALGAWEFLTIMFSLILGGISGVLLNIEGNLEKFGSWLKERAKSQETSFIEGFVVASIIFETGPMAILGSINDGLQGDLTLLLIKSGLDGIMSIALASTFGVGVIFSIISVALYQGSITLFAILFGAVLPEIVIIMIRIVGGILILGLGVRILELQDIPIGNMIPAIFWAIPITILVDFLMLW